jgi:hypothetical protein
MSLSKMAKNFVINGKKKGSGQEVFTGLLVVMENKLIKTEA